MSISLHTSLQATSSEIIIKNKRPSTILEIPVKSKEEPKIVIEPHHNGPEIMIKEKGKTKSRIIVKRSS